MWNSYNILTFTILRHFRTVPMGTVRILWFFLVLRNFWVGPVKKTTLYESYLVMKVIIVKEVMTCDVSPVTKFKIQNYAIAHLNGPAAALVWAMREAQRMRMEKEREDSAIQSLRAAIKPRLDPDLRNDHLL